MKLNAHVENRIEYLIFAYLKHSQEAFTCVLTRNTPLKRMLILPSTWYYLEHLSCREF